MAQPNVVAKYAPVSAAVPCHLRVASRSDRGRVRRKNEDAMMIRDLNGEVAVSSEASLRIDVGERGILLAVSDGMGGAEAGEIASAIVVDELARAMNELPTRDFGEEGLKGAIEHAHEAVQEASKERSEGVPRERRMGATLTAVHVAHGEALIGQVGDSRAYLLRNGRIFRLTHDQTMVQALVDGGVISSKESKHSPLRNVILQAMGHATKIQVAETRVELRNRDCLLLCSDGLSNVLSDDEIRDVLLASADLDAAASKFIEVANERGGPDNVTVLLAGVSGALPLAPSREPIEQTVSIVSNYEDRSRLGRL